MRAHVHECVSLSVDILRGERNVFSELAKTHHILLFSIRAQIFSSIDPVLAP